MHRALLELTIEGVDTSRDFHLRVMENGDFRRGDIEIQWLERHLDELTHVPPPRDGVVRAAIAAVLIAERDRTAPRATATGQSTPPARDTGDNWARVARLEALR
jgi:acetyl-CoA carboxylase biotin carboxylase subunit